MILHCCGPLQSSHVVRKHASRRCSARYRLQAAPQDRNTQQTSRSPPTAPPPKQRDPAIRQSQWEMWDALMSEGSGFSASVVPSSSPFGSGLAWNRDKTVDQNDTVAASVPSQYILSNSRSPRFCQAVQASPAMQAIYAEPDHVWEIKVGAALLWAVRQGPKLFNGFWANYAREFMPPLKDLTSTLTMSPQELRLLEDTRLVHKSLAWQDKVREAYHSFIACPAFAAECDGAAPSFDQFLWATACAESRAYEIEVDGEDVCVVVPIFDLANHRHGAVVGARLQPTLSETGNMELHTYDVFSCSSSSGAGETALRSTTDQPDGSKAANNEQVHFFSNYGDKNGQALLDQYGFTVPGNPIDRLSLDKQYAGTISSRNSTDDPFHSSSTLQEPGKPPLTMRRDLVFRTAEHLLGLEFQVDGSSTDNNRSPPASASSQPAARASAAVSKALQRPDLMGSALKDLGSAMIDQARSVSDGVASTASSSRENWMSESSESVSSSNSSDKSAGVRNDGRSLNWWWKADEGVLRELLVMAAEANPNGVQEESLKRVESVLQPFFSAGPVRARMRTAAFSVVGAYGWRSMSAYNSITLDGERLCVEQAEEHVKQSLLLSFSSPSPVKEVVALLNLELSGDATSGTAARIEGGGLAANNRSVAALQNRMERKLQAGTCLALLKQLKHALA